MCYLWLLFALLHCLCILQTITMQKKFLNKTSHFKSGEKYSKQWKIWAFHVHCSYLHAEYNGLSCQRWDALIHPVTHTHLHRPTIHTCMHARMHAVKNYSVLKQSAWNLLSGIQIPWTDLVSQKYPKSNIIRSMEL